MDTRPEALNERLQFGEVGGSHAADVGVLSQDQGIARESRQMYAHDSPEEQHANRGSAGWQVEGSIAYKATIKSSKRLSAGSNPHRNEPDTCA